MNRLLNRLQIKCDPSSHFDSHYSQKINQILDELRKLNTLFYAFGKLEIYPANLEQSSAPAKLKKRVETRQDYLIWDQLISESRTAKLWVQCMSQFNLIKMFMRTERTGDWEEHLAAIKKILNFYAATGHFKYAKSTRLYFQTIFRLGFEQDFLWLHRQH